MTSPASPHAGSAAPALYRDQGCNLAPSCLTCPFVLCQYDLPSVQDKDHNRYDHVVWAKALVFFEDVSIADSDGEAASYAGIAYRFGGELRTAARWIRAMLDTL